jgi:XTP/dITP diphosphohydrolase
MTDIVLASSNPGKVREINQLLAGLNFQVRPQSDFGVEDAEETGLTFVENAILEVDALNGAPGIYSARYAGNDASDEANLQKLLVDIREVAEAQRTARFQCLMVYMRHAGDPTPLICQGTWEGRILFEPRGEHGFGYDPVFYVPTHDCASAELAPEVKNSLSHRGQALRKLVAALAV